MSSQGPLAVRGRSRFDLRRRLGSAKALHLDWTWLGLTTTVNPIHDDKEGPNSGQDHDDDHDHDDDNHADGDGYDVMMLLANDGPGRGWHQGDDGLQC